MNYAKNMGFAAMAKGQRTRIRKDAIFCMSDIECQKANSKILWHGKSIYISVAAAMDKAHSMMKDLMFEESRTSGKEKRLRYGARKNANTAWQRIELYMERINKNTKKDAVLYCDILDELDTATENSVETLQAKTSSVLVKNGIRDPFFKARMEVVMMMLDLGKTVFDTICKEVIEDTNIARAGKCFQDYDPKPICDWWENAVNAICNYPDRVKEEIVQVIQEELDKLYNRIVHTADLMDNVVAKHPEIKERFKEKQ